MDDNKNQNDNKTSAAKSQFVVLMSKILTKDIWNKSFLLKNAHKRLTKIVDDIKISLAKESHLETKITAEQEGKKTGYVKVYISLYQQDGRNLQLEERERFLFDVPLSHPRELISEVLC